MNSAIGLQHYLIVSIALFALGVYGVVSRRNAIAVLMSIELILNAAGLNFIAFWRYANGPGAAAMTGPVFSLIIITVAAAEAAIGLAIVLSVYRRFDSVEVDEVNLMEG